MEMALGSGRKSRVFHPDKSYQFISSIFVERPRKDKIKISWSGSKHCSDNILVEWRWQTAKDEEVYLSPYEDGWDAAISLIRFLWRYCHVKSLRFLGGQNTLCSIY
jgi:putative transposase